MLKLPGYQCLKKIYESKRASVYQGYCNQDNSPVIIKLLNRDYPSQEELAEYKHEYEFTSGLNLKGVIHPLKLLQYKNTLAIIFEDSGGISLKTYLETKRPDIKDFLILAISMTDILSDIYKAGIIHRDINPANILLNPETGDIKLIDFGLAVKLSPEKKSLNIEGNLSYISPEQTGRTSHPVDYRTDFYSLGITFYEVLTGKLPFETNDDMELIHSHLAVIPASPHIVKPDIPEVISDIIMKLISKNPEDRYQNALALKHDFTCCLNQLTANGRIDNFPPGQRDISGEFHIPHKLYGRQKEVSILLDSFHRVQKGKSELLLVSGYSGIGKSSLVEEIDKPIAEKRGHFISGKFDQYKRNIPYSAFIQAFQSLMNQILTEKEEYLLLWKEKILNVLGHNGHLMTDVISNLELIIGSQPEAPCLPPIESKNRFNIVFQNFVEIFAAESHPLVIFLDDLQWTDLSSLKLMEILLSNYDSKHILIIGAYRSNEVDNSHPLTKTINEISQRGTVINNISLDTLDIDNINQMLSETLNCPLSETIALSHLSVKKTGGNPFFLKQFLTLLNEDGYIVFHQQELKWFWDIEKIIKAEITENVADFMTGKIKKLALQTQDVLKIASCIGNTFDLKLLSEINHKTEKEIFRDLREAIREELIISPDDTYFRFTHDRIHQSVYSLIDLSKRCEINLTIGRLMVKNINKEEMGEHIFDAVNHFNEALHLINNKELAEIRNLNFLAGKRARLSLAYESAINYLNTAISLLDDNCWDSDYEKTLSIYIETAEVAFLRGDFSYMEKIGREVLNHGKTILDKIFIYKLQNDVCVAEHRPLDAINILLFVLRELGIYFPENPTLSDIENRISDIMAKLSGKEEADFFNIPPMTDRYKLAAMEILTSAAPSAYQTCPLLFPLVVLTMVDLTMEYGWNSLSPYGFVTYGMVISIFKGYIDYACRFGKLAFDVMDKFTANKNKHQVIHVYCAFLIHHKEHLKKTIPSFLEELSLAMEAGDLEFVALVSHFICYHSFFLGKNLSELKNETIYYTDLTRKIKQNSILHFIEPYRLSVLNLIEITEKPWELIDTTFNEKEMIPILEKVNQKYSLFHLYFVKIFLSYFFHNYEEAKNYIANMEKIFDGGTSTFISDSLFNFYHSLIFLAGYPEADPSEKESIIKSVELDLRKIKNSAEHAPMNNLHKLYLVEAEKCSILGQKAEAIDLYDMAIAKARENEYIHEEALANELAGKFYMNWGKETIAGAYMAEARYCYQRWGADAKIQQLETDYPRLFKSSEETFNTGSSSSSNNIDLKTVIKSSHAISAEVILPELLKKIMKIILENSGAQKGILLMKNQNTWFIESQGTKNEIYISRIPLEENKTCPSSIVLYTARTKESLVLNDAVNEGDFINDIYVIAGQIRSVLCVPILRHNEVTGVIYLENNLITGAFTPDRIEILKILASQAAISLENATLYSNLEQKVAERTSQLEQAKEEAEKANTELKSSEAYLQLQFNRMPLGCIVWGKDFRVKSWNPASEKIFGYSAEEAMGRLKSELIVPQDEKEDVYKIWKRLLEGDMTANRINDNLTKNGDRIICEWTNTPLMDSEGKIQGVISMVQDITKRIKAEEAEKDEYYLNRTIIDSIPGPFYILDAHCRLVRWNSYERDEIFGKQENELAGLNIIENIHPDDRAFVQSKIEKVLKSGLEDTMEGRILIKGGPEFRWFLMTGRRIIIKNSPFLVGIDIDITKRKQAEEALKESEANYRSLFQNAPVGLFHSTVKGEFIRVNPELVRMLGYSSPEELISGISDMSIQIYLDRKKRTEIVASMLKQNDWIHDGGVPWRRKDGNIIIVNMRGRKVLNSDGHISYLEGFVDDITDRKKAENALMDALTAAEEANKTKSLFLANMSHELRTPLNSILGYAELFRQDTGLSEDYKRGINIIEKSGKHLLEIINDILDLAKIESGKVELENQSFNLKNLLYFIEEMIKVKVKQKELIFNTEYSGDLPLYVSGDEKKLSQSLINLLGNAVKFTQKGKVTFIVKKQNERISFTVEDTGFGIAEEGLEEIFLPFKQLGDHMRKTEGTGLGLAITRNMVKLMGGQLKVESIYGKGSKFYFEIELPEVSTPESYQLSRESAIIGHKGEKRKILIVDDKPENRMVLTDILNRAGFYVEEAENGTECLEKLDKFRPDLIFMDIIMPEMDGYETTRKIRENKLYKDIKIIAISASKLDKSILEIMRIGFDDWLSKPFLYSDLLALLSTHLQMEWIYDYSSNKKEEEKVIIPPLNIIENLYKISMKSNFKLIIKELEKIKKSDKDYIAFYRKFKELADGFEIKNIRNLLKKYMEEVK